jgi:hypothetical protein
MNIIWDKLNELKPTYWIHMEDDFLFYDKMNYIANSIRALETLSDQHVFQVLFNVNYAETVGQYNSRGATKISDDFAIHQHKLGNFHYPNCHYWPHYSFRPSIILTEKILGLGNYESSNTFFERDYADKWNAAGYKSAFFNKITNKHIGRLASDRNNKSIPNAYQLNGVDQFNTDSDFDSISDSDIFIHTSNSKINMKTSLPIKIINLKRRPDRKAVTSRLLKQQNILENQYEFIEAIDGKKIQPSVNLYNLFIINGFSRYI